MSSNGQTCTPWQQNSNPEVGDLVRCQNQISIGRYFLEREPLSGNLGSRIRPEFWEPGHCYDPPRPPTRRFPFAPLRSHFIFWNSSAVCGKSRGWNGISRRSSAPSWRRCVPSRRTHSGSTLGNQDQGWGWAPSQGQKASACGI